MTTNKTAFKTKEITATSRASVHIGDSYFTFEASETRVVNHDQLPKDLNDAEQAITDEWLALFDTVNGQVDNQIADLQKYLQTKK